MVTAFYLTFIVIGVIKQFVSFSMTQRQLDISQYRLNYDEFFFKEVTCELNDKFSIVVKSQRHSIQIFLKTGRRRLKIPFNTFEGLYHSHLSVTYLIHFLEEN